MISTDDLTDNSPEPDWLSEALLPKSPRGLPPVRLTTEIERQMRRRDRQISELRDWLADREAADSRCGGRGRG